jgi:hypothetical protein
VTRDASAIGLLQHCSQAMGSPDPDLTIQAQGTATPLAKGGPTTQLTLRAKGLSSLRIDSVSQMRSGKTLTDSLIYGRGRGRWTPDQQYQNHFYSAAQYSHPQLMPLQICSVALTDTDLSIETVSSTPNDPANTVHVRSFVDKQDSSGKHDELTKKLSQLDIYINSETFLPASAKSFSFDAANLLTSTTWKTDYSQYTAVQGMSYPATVTETLGSQKIRSISWSNVTLGASIEDAAFDPENN